MSPRPPVPGPRLLAGALLLAAALGACGEPAAGVRSAAPAPGWVDLAAAFQPPALGELAERLEAGVQPPRAARLVPGGKRGDELWFELPLPRASWTRDESSGFWSTPLPRRGALLAGESQTQVLCEGTTALRFGQPRRPRAGRHWFEGERIFVSVAREAEPSDELVYRMRLDHGRRVEGAWRVGQGDLACNGFLVFPGLPATLEVEIPRDSRLSFASVSPDPSGMGASLAPTRFRVQLDGRTLLEHEQPFARPVRSTVHRLELDTAGRHVLTFEVEGEAPALIAVPLLEPRTIGRPDARPWTETRPDLVLVLCDTFRADNLAAWGGRAELAPRLNHFVEGSLRFLDARAVAAWTLPSIATILAGVYPGQHGATDLDRGVSPAVETLAEVLARQGYRTAAVTDSGLFSRHYGQDQGFQWFEEVPSALWNLNQTLVRARARMAADDGRPLFLVVHTYRVHGPMRVGPDEDLGALQEVRAAVSARLAERRAAGEDIGHMEAALEFADEGRLIYENAVQDLDLKVGAWLEELAEQGFLARGQIVLTADHGNAHGEHDQVGHGSDLYDVKLRVPLAIAGRGIVPRAVSGAVSLVDLAPTLTNLAGLQPSTTWAGHSLLERTPAGPIYAFNLRAEERQIALYDGTKKVMALDLDALRAGAPLFAFDLEQDPAEDHNLVGGPEWAAALARRLAASLEPLLVPLAASTSLELPEDVLRELQGLGYTGGDTVYSGE